MDTTDAPGHSRLSRLGWLIVLAASALVLAYGMTTFFSGPEMALADIAERTTLTPDEFRLGAPSASDVILIIVRQQAAFETAFGILALLVAWHGFRHGSRRAWLASWVLVAAIAAAGVSFLPAGGAAQGALYLGLAGLVSVALLLARTNRLPA